MALVVGIASCSSSPTAPSPQTLEGTWQATRAEFVNAANSSQRVEAIAQGSSVVLVLSANGTFTLTTTTPGASPEVRSGSWSASSDVLTLLPTGSTGNIQFDMSLSGSTLTLDGGHVSYDVNGDNMDEETILSMTLTRQ